ncbi:glycosyltransferase family 9 protein [Achromobacter sp. NPDC058515]|uniref:glycosyltransferase family 9 protein n=1 Tax=Achromobacter sp. NPDC058515 TaxID=3346533 RepID=UPI00364665BC
MSDVVVFVRSQRRFGDQIVAFSALYLLKQLWADKAVRVVSRYDVGHFYRELPWVDEFVRAGAFVEQFRALPRRAEVSVNFHHSSERYALISLLRRPALRMGFDNNRLGDRVWTHRHRKDINEYIGLANLRLLGAYQEHDPEDVARQCFARIAMPYRHEVEPADIVLIPGGGSGEFKRWALEHYIALADLLQQKLGGHAVFTFVLGPDETAELERLKQLGRRDFRIEFCRPVGALAALMQDARLVVSNDCGPSHIAQGLCLPYVGVFNEPNPEWFWARECTRDVVPDNASKEINSIQPARVLRACMEVLAASSSQPAHLSRAAT